MDRVGISATSIINTVTASHRLTGDAAGDRLQHITQTTARDSAR